MDRRHSMSTQPRGVCVAQLGQHAEGAAHSTRVLFSARGRLRSAYYDCVFNRDYCQRRRGHSGKAVAHWFQCARARASFLSSLGTNRCILSRVTGDRVALFVERRLWMAYDLPYFVSLHGLVWLSNNRVEKEKCTEEKHRHKRKATNDR